MKNKNNKRKKFSSRVTAVLLALVCQATLLTACGSAEYASDTTTASYDYAADAGYYEESYDDYEVEESADVDSTKTVSADRKLIKTVDISLETENYDNLLSNIESQVTALGGYIENRASSNRSYSSPTYEGEYLRYTSMTVRIPQENLDSFLTSVSEQTNVVSLSENVDDVTLQYVDMESHKKALQTEQSRLLELLEQAQTVEDIIAIEDRLSEVRYQIESMESQLRTYDNKIDYSTVYLSIDEVVKYTPTEPETVGERIRNGFLDSVEGVKDGLTEFAIWFVVNLPYLAVWVVIIALVVAVVLFVRRRIRRREAKRAAKNPYCNGQPGNLYVRQNNPYEQAGNPYMQVPNGYQGNPCEQAPPGSDTAQSGSIHDPQNSRNDSTNQQQ